VAPNVLRASDVVVGQLGRSTTPWQAVQIAAWAAVNRGKAAGTGE
jgi:hypothetical protein